MKLRFINRFYKLDQLDTIDYGPIHAEAGTGALGKYRKVLQFLDNNTNTWVDVPIHDSSEPPDLIDNAQ